MFLGLQSKERIVFLPQRIMGAGGNLGSLSGQRKLACEGLGGVLYAVGLVCEKALW